MLSIVVQVLLSLVVIAVPLFGLEVSNYALVCLLAVAYNGLISEIRNKGRERR